ncbi:MAG TPA: hypothetical protein VF815_13545 [Myxococcaceae bacterium]|jgi:hypothetical protein
MFRTSVSAAVLLLSSPALAGEVLYQFRSEEDPKAVADPIAACKVAPFEVNVRLPGSLFVPEQNPADGKVKAGGQKKVGTALACVRITDRTFPEGSQADMYARFEVPEGRFVAVGKCTVVSNAVPRAGIVLAGCALKLTEQPAAYAGGFVTSASVFNPLGQPGFNTGSLWTLRVFEPEAQPPKQPAKDPGKDAAKEPKK